MTRSSVRFGCAILGLLRNMDIEKSWQCCARLQYLQCRHMLPTDRTLCLLTFCVHIIGLLSLRVTCVILNLTYLTLYVAVLSIVGANDPAIYLILTKYTGCIFYAVPEHCSCHGMSRRMQDFCAIMLPCSGIR